MIVVTAGTSEYRPIIDAQARKCKEFSYSHLIYDLGGLGIGEPYAVEREDLEPTVNGDSLPPATFKCALVKRAMSHAKPDELVCWLDADCIPLREFAPGLEAMETFDAAVTLRPAPEVGLSNNPALDYLNSGVVWIRNTDAGWRFLADWECTTMATHTDQGGLNLAVARSFDAVQWEGARRCIVVSIRSGARILVLDAMEWNSWHPPFTGTRIAHFKRGLRGQAVNYL